MSSIDTLAVVLDSQRCENIENHPVLELVLLKSSWHQLQEIHVRFLVLNSIVQWQTFTPGPDSDSLDVS